MLNKVIQALGYSEDKDGARIMISLGLTVLCTSCDPPMILDSRSLVIILFYFARGKTRH